MSSYVESQRSATPVNVLAAPTALQSFDQWVNWHYEERDGRATKVPLHYPGARRDTIAGELHTFFPRASSTDPDTWVSFEQAALNAVYAAESPTRGLILCGVGFVLQESNGIVGIDFDHCLEPGTFTFTNAKIEAWVLSLATYTERSPSGIGVRCLGFGVKPGTLCKHTGRGVEVYNRARFLTVTGDVFPWSPADLAEFTPALAAFYAELFADKIAASKPTASGAASHMPAALLTLNLTDQQIIDLASRSRNGDRFSAIWHGDASAYPSNSEADFALAGMLAFYVGPDAGRVESLMLQSGLRRAKWNQRNATNGTYLASTVANAIAGKSEFYGQGGTVWHGYADEDLDGITVSFRKTKCPATPPSPEAMAAVTAGAAAIAVMFPDSSLAAAGKEIANERKTTDEISKIIEKNYAEIRRNSPSCPNCHSFWLDHIDKPHSLAMQSRCWSRRCPACGPMRKRQDREAVRPRLMFHAGPLFVYECPSAAAWKNRAYPHIREANGDFIRYSRGVGSSGSSVVISTVEIRCSKMISAGKAVEILHDAIDSWQPSHLPGVHNCPMSHSKRWKPPCPRSASLRKYTRRGRIPREFFAGVQQVVEEFGARVRILAIPDHLLPEVTAILRIDHPKDWGAAETEAVYWRACGDWTRPWPDPEGDDRESEQYDEWAVPPPTPVQSVPRGPGTFDVVTGPPG